MPNSWQAIAWTHVNPDHLLTQHGIFNAKWMDLMKYRRASFDELILKDPIVQSVERIFSYPQVEYNAVNFTQ